MQPYGLNINNSMNVHPHNECDICCAFVKNKKTARQEAKKEIKHELERSNKDRTNKR